MSDEWDIQSVDHGVRACECGEGYQVFFAVDFGDPPDEAGWHLYAERTGEGLLAEDLCIGCDGVLDLKLRLHELED